MEEYANRLTNAEMELQEAKQKMQEIIASSPDTDAAQNQRLMRAMHDMERALMPEEEHGTRKMYKCGPDHYRYLDDPGWCLG